MSSSYDYVMSNSGLLLSKLSGVFSSIFCSCFFFFPRPSLLLLLAYWAPSDPSVRVRSHRLISIIDGEFAISLHHALDVACSYIYLSHLSWCCYLRSISICICTPKSYVTLPFTQTVYFFLSRWYKLLAAALSLSVSSFWHEKGYMWPLSTSVLFSKLEFNNLICCVPKVYDPQIQPIYLYKALIWPWMSS